MGTLVTEVPCSLKFWTFFGDYEMREKWWTSNGRSLAWLKVSTLDLILYIQLRVKVKVTSDTTVENKTSPFCGIFFHIGDLRVLFVVLVPMTLWMGVRRRWGITSWEESQSALQFLASVSLHFIFIWYLNVCRFKRFSESAGLQSHRHGNFVFVPGLWEFNILWANRQIREEKKKNPGWCAGEGS